LHNRYTVRKAFADGIVSTRADELWKYGISRIAEITNFDVIGIPVWTGCRPLSKTVSLHAGKSLDSNMSKAGAIMESIEFEISQTPVGDYLHTSYNDIPKGYALDWRDCTLSRNSIINDNTIIPWEIVDNLNGGVMYVPSAMIWMSPREKEYFNLNVRMGRSPE
jgi:ribosomal protein S12 methylthiotransferase accessory factor